MTKDDFEILKELTTKFEKCYDELYEKIDDNLDTTYESTYSIINKLYELYNIYQKIVYKVKSLFSDDIFLKPCPCCGGKAEVCITQGTIQDAYYVQCIDCFIKTFDSIDKNLVMETWNYRKSEEEK